MKTPEEILQLAIKAYKVKKPSYSNNALARDLGVAPSFLSNILNGKKSIPIKLIEKIFNFLKFNDEEKRAFLRSLYIKLYQGSILEKYIEDLNVFSVEQFIKLEQDTHSLLDNWYYIALLEFFSCSNFVDNKEFLAKKFQITEVEVTKALFVMESEGFFIRDSSNNFKKKNSLLSLPGKNNSKQLKGFHAQMISKALDCLNIETTEEAYKKRTLSGLTIAVDPKNITKAIKMLERSMHDISLELSKGECSEVYQLNVQLFPLSN